MQTYLHKCQPCHISFEICSIKSQFCHLGKFRLIVNNALQWKEKEGVLSLSYSGIYKWPLQLILPIG